MKPKILFGTAGTPASAKTRSSAAGRGRKACCGKAVEGSSEKRKAGENLILSTLVFRNNT